MNYLTILYIAVLSLILALPVPGYSHTPHNDKKTAASSHQHEHDEHEDEHDEVSISEQMQQKNGIETAVAASGVLQKITPLFGIISIIPQQQFRIQAPYPGIVQQMQVSVGDTVSRGQEVATVRNNSTLQIYSITAPAAGIVTGQPLNAGDLAADTPLLEISNLSQVWAEMSAFPDDLFRLKTGNSLTVRDLHRNIHAQSSLSYISPLMTGGHIARVRAVLSNDNGHWRPGMHIAADIITAEEPVAVRIPKTALQQIDEQQVVFIRSGNTFMPQQVQLGRQDNHYVEVLSGLHAGDEYVAVNSFIIKADLLKSGAGHEH
ncbi:efflux RND transporter periplasmic adaptor subunit [Chromatiaceae bacterium AAb-1]|nr:efflux RND transporter periplasmic adaptor subunit [Chromatiaceae bacterium AAb-1]